MADTSNDRDGSASNQERITVQGFLLQNKYDACLWILRILIMFCTFCYLIPILGVGFGQSCFKRVLIASAAVSALRLHQRMPSIQLSTEFAKTLVIEDSFHYLAYSILFLFSNAATMMLMPIVMFAVLHAASYTKKVIAVSGSNNFFYTKITQLIGKIERSETQTQMLTFIATTEIMVLPVSILMVFSGQSTILVPFFYYRFLQLRYSSRRNPYSRMVFRQFRVGIEQLMYNPRCPGFARKILQALISITLRLSPPVAAQ